MREVCAHAGIDPHKVAYVEAHGTGTALGDPTEAAAIGAVYGRQRSERADPCIIGSVKSNIGHLEAASGIAGIIKSVLCLVHNRIPPLGTLEAPNPSIPFTSLGLRLADDLLPLAGRSSPAFIGVNSFGYGGTNAHVILDAAPRQEAEPQLPAALPPLLISARTEASLRELVRSWHDKLVTTPDARLPALLCAAARGRPSAAAGTFSFNRRSAVAWVSFAISSGASAMRSRNFRPAIFGA